MLWRSGRATRPAPAARERRRKMRRARKYQAAAWTMFAVGAPTLLIAPAMIAGFISGIELRFATHWHVNWWLSFLSACAALIPLLFLIEWRTRGRWYENELREQGTT